MKKYLLAFLLLAALIPKGFAQQPTSSVSSLTVKQKHIALIAAYTAEGKVAQLSPIFSAALDAGITINEIKEVLVHLAAYCGFPRSLQGINTFMRLLDTRKLQGLNDKPGREASAATYKHSRYEQGKKVLEILTGKPAQQAGYAVFAPVIDTLLKEYLFADLFGRDLLTYTERELTTLAALIALGEVDPMLQSHTRITLHLGVTEVALQQLYSLLEEHLGKDKADAGRNVLAGITKKRAYTDSTAVSDNLFAKGVRAPAANFTGVVWVNILTRPEDSLDCSIGVVTFEPGARTNWHMHPGGQMLLVTEGSGYYQEKGGLRKQMKKGDVVKCPEGVEHWHGAAENSKLTHIAIAPDAEKGGAVWLGPVSAKDYNNN